MSDEQQTKTRAVAVVNGTSMTTDTGRFEHSFRVAKVFAGSQLVPKHLQGKVEDVMIALHIADRLGEDPLTVMQAIYIVSGKAGWSSSYMIARINRSGLIKGRIRWDVKGEGKSLQVTARATLAEDGEEVTAPVSMEMAIAEGWTSNKKYQSMPELMLRYRSAAMLQRLYVPEVMLGMPAAEELEDEPASTIDVTPPRRSAADALAHFADSPSGGGLPAGTIFQAPGGNLIVPPGTTVTSDGAAFPTPPMQTGGEILREDHRVVDVKAEEPPKPKRERKPKAEPMPATVTEVIDEDTGEITEVTTIADETDAQGDGEAFDPEDYLQHCISVLPSLRDQAEVDAAHEEVKKMLVKYPSHLGRWVAAKLGRQKITDKAR